MAGRRGASFHLLAPEARDGSLRERHLGVGPRQGEDVPEHRDEAERRCRSLPLLRDGVLAEPSPVRDQRGGSEGKIHRSPVRDTDWKLTRSPFITSSQELFFDPRAKELDPDRHPRPELEPHNSVDATPTTKQVVVSEDADEDADLASFYEMERRSSRRQSEINEEAAKVSAGAVPQYPPPASTATSLLVIPPARHPYSPRDTGALLRPACQGARSRPPPAPGP